MNPLSKRQSLGFCLLSGLLVCLSLPNFLDKTLTPWGAPLAWIALVPFFWVLREASPGQGALFGWVFGLAQFGGILYWILFIKEVQYLCLPAWLALVLYQSLFPLLLGWAAAGWRRRPGDFLGLWIPALWVGMEFIRTHWLFGGFPWGQIGYALAPYPSFLVLASLGGVYALTFLVVWVNASFARGLVFFFGGEKGRWPRYWLLPPVLLVLIFGWGSWRVRQTPLALKGSVAIVQPDIDQSVKWDRAYADETYRRLEKWTLAAGRGKPDLILWPETSAPSFLLWTPNDFKRVSGIVRRVGTPLLAGCLDLSRGGQAPEADYNAAVHFRPDGRPQGVYRKRHLVPFGEYVPFQKYLWFLGPVVRDLGSFQPGPSYCSFPAGGFTYSPVICYEAIFPEDIREACAGADVLVNISNDAWYGQTACAYQHAMMAVVRAAEERKPLFRCANTGVSLATDPLGRILGQTPLFEQTLLTLPVYESPGPSVYARGGHWFPWGCLGWVLAVWLFSARLKRIRPHE
ncbi:MAG TPA: apolipoprotein N-acyltransferase [bacterium]|nr:apolipoprotein N-acyltransferase [bacterium]